MKRTLSILLAVVLMMSCLTLTANAVSKVTVRIEGASKNIFYNTVSMDLTATTTVADVLSYIDDNNADISIIGADSGYVTEVNGEKAGKFGGWDGWYYAVNDTVPDVGLGSYTVSAGDSIVLYYGDYSCQYPVADLSNIQKGIIKFSSYDVSYDADWNPTYAWAPVTDAVVTLNGISYTTDRNGEILIEPANITGFVNIQISKLSTTGAPAVCRFASDFGFYSGSSSVTVRIEGSEDTYYYDTIKVNLTDKTTVADVLSIVDENDISLSISGLDSGYITEVNEEKAGKFGGWDGWNYAVNDSVPDVGVGSYNVKDGDSIVLYYGDYPCQYPKADFSKIDKGIITLTSYDATYDADWNSTYSWTPVTDADITVNGVSYTTDDKGQVTIDTTDLSGYVNVQVSKKNSTGAPAVCRFASDFGFSYSDINGDSRININDATVLQRHIAKTAELSDNGLKVSDVNNDGEIDVNDVTSLQKQIAGIR